MLLIPRAKKNTDSAQAFHRRFEGHLLLSIFCAGVPGVVVALLLVWGRSFSLDHKLEFTALVVLPWIGLTISARDKVVNSLHTLSNVIMAVKDEDFSFRATKAFPGDALGELALEINTLARALADERLGSLETTNLLRRVMAEAATIIFSFSPDDRLQIINRAGLRFLGKDEEEEVLNRSAQELGIQQLVKGPTWEVISRLDSGVEKRWIVQRAVFRQSGEPHRLIVLAEASEALRAEERLAWQRLIRVLSHEMNNSLAPIRTIARTLARMASETKLPAPISENLPHGLEVIADRVDSLSRFLQSYARLANLPAPVPKAFPLDSLLARVALLEPRLPVMVISGPPVYVDVDSDQLEQALINLVKNAADSVLLASANEIGPQAVTISWTIQSKDVEICIRDEGTGLTKSENLFVPFYTTKQSGSGIGLLLSRQIVEAHGGSLILKNRVDRTGCEAEVKLPMRVSKSA